MAAVYERASSRALDDTIHTAMEKSDAAAVAPLRDELQGLVDWVERLMGEHGLEDQARGLAGAWVCGRYTCAGKSTGAASRAGGVTAVQPVPRGQAGLGMHV